MRELIDEYAVILDSIYQNRTAGDYTFEGVLFEFALKVIEQQKQDKIIPPTIVPYG